MSCPGNKLSAKDLILKTITYLMQAIRAKITVAIILLLAAMVVSAVIYVRGGFSITGNNETEAFCGTASFEPAITNNDGRELFFANCASCHSITKDLTGPALAGFEKHFPPGLLYLFLQKPKKAYKKSKYLARLKQQYEMEHFAFPSLTKKDIDNIRQYINATAIPIP